MGRIRLRPLLLRPSASAGAAAGAAAGAVLFWGDACMHAGLTFDW